MDIKEKREIHINSIFIDNVEEIINNQTYSDKYKIDLIKNHLEAVKRLYNRL
jgi:hypothetical protein